MPLFFFSVDGNITELINRGEVVQCKTERFLKMWKNGSESEQDNCESLNEDTKKEFSRTSLLLSLFQMAAENYPLVTFTQSMRFVIIHYSLLEEFGFHNEFISLGCTDYVYTKDEYLPVTSHSPLFSIDCEMVRISCAVVYG